MVALVVVRVHVDDEEILVAPPDRLLPGIGENAILVEFLGGRIAEHDVLAVHRVFLLEAVRLARPRGRIRRST